MNNINRGVSRFIFTDYSAVSVDSNSLNLTGLREETW